MEYGMGTAKSRAMQPGEFLYFINRGKVVVAYGQLKDIPKIVDKQTEHSDLMVQQKMLCDWSETGAAKTLTALLAVRAFIEDYDNRDKKVLIACPTVAVRNWINWTGTMINHNFDGGMLYWGDIQVITTAKEQVLQNARIIIVKYDLLSDRSNNAFRSIKAIAPAMVILDEAHRVRNLTTKRAQAIWGRQGGNNYGITAGAESIIPLTATPVWRYYDDLFAMLITMFPQALKEDGTETLQKFQHMYCAMRRVAYGNGRQSKMEVCGNRNKDRLTALLNKRNVFVKRSLTDFKLAVPQVVTRDVFFQVDHDIELNAALKYLDEASQDEELFSTISGARATAFRLLGKAIATKVADYVIEEIEKKRVQGDYTGILVIYYHKEVGIEIQKRIHKKSGYVADLISGGTSQVFRNENEDRFNQLLSDCLVGQIETMGESLNLQKGGYHIVMAERDWSNARERQAVGRVLRLGQSNEYVLVDIVGTQHDLSMAKDRVSTNKKSGADAVTRKKV